MPRNDRNSKVIQVSQMIRDFFNSAWRKFVSALQYLRANPRWLWAGLLIAGGIYLGSWLEDENAFLDVRYKAHQFTQNLGSKLKGELYDHNTIVVLIDDDAYWKGSYEGRRPINQQSLGELVKKINEYKPTVIALDFDLRSPMPDGSVIQYSTYAEDTKKFAEAIKAVSSSGTKVILAKTLGYEGPSWITESDTYDGQDIGDAHFGYIALKDDYRIIPASVKLRNGSRLDSFSQAIVRAFDLTGAALHFDRHDGSPTYAGPYLEEDQFAQYSAGDFSSTDAATHQELVNKLHGKIVIVGGAWNRFAYGRGPRIDERTTPADTAPAVFLHANWVETILQQRAAKPVAKWAAILLEVVLGLIGYAVFSYRMRWYWKAIYAIGVLPFWLIVAYVSAQNLGLFFDPFTPTLISFGKAGYEEIDEWRKDAKKYRSKESTQPGKPGKDGDPKDRSPAPSKTEKPEEKKEVANATA